MPRAGPFRPLLLQRYVLSGVVATAVGTMLICAVIMASMNVINDLLGYLIDGAIPLGVAAKLIALLFPFVASFALPVGILIGVLISFGRLSADSEIVAMRSAGVSLIRVAAPVLMFGLLGVAGELMTNFVWMPAARATYHDLLDATLRGSPLELLPSHTFIRTFPGVVVYVEERNDNRVRDVWFWQFNKAHAVEKFIRAKSGRINIDMNASAITLNLVDAETWVPQPYPKVPQSIWGRECQIALSADQFLGKPHRRRKLAWLSISELREEWKHIAALPDSAARTLDLMRVSVTVQDKLSLGMAAFLFAMIAIPLAMVTKRKETSANIGISLLLVVVYYALSVAIKGLTKYPALHPDLLLWVPNLMFFALGLWLFARAQRV